MSTEKRVNIGMIGAGWWPNTMHMPALAACALVAIMALKLIAYLPRFHY